MTAMKNKTGVLSVPRERGRLAIQYGLLILLFLLLFLLQSVPGMFPRLGGVRAYLLIPAVVSLSLLKGEWVGALFGLFSGVMWDAVSAEVSGFHPLFLMTFGCACGLLVSHYLRNSPLSGFVLMMAVTFCHFFFYWFFFVAMRGYPGMWSLLGGMYLPSVFYTALFYFPLYYLIRAICRISA